MGATRRGVLVGAAMLAALPARAAKSFRLGLTPVFLDNDAAVVETLRAALAGSMGASVAFEQRRSYQEVTGLLLEGSVDAAWLCGFPFLMHEAALSLLAAPLWRGAPLYRSYLIAGADDPAQGLTDLAGGAHAFSDPDSNSGWLVTASDLARRGLRPDAHFARTLFAWGHRNVVRAVASGLTRSGSVDGYVWEALTEVEPTLTARTRVVTRSEPMGFPPFVARADRAADADLSAFRAALLGLSGSQAGRAALGLLRLDGMIPADRALYGGIAARLRDVEGLR
jgi:phosphonate transport system substrate-binding protein